MSINSQYDSPYSSSHLNLIVYRKPGIDVVLLRTENMSRESLWLSPASVTDPMQLSREPNGDFLFQIKIVKESLSSKKDSGIRSCESYRNISWEYVISESPYPSFHNSLRNSKRNSEPFFTRIPVWSTFATNYLPNWIKSCDFGLKLSVLNLIFQFY